MTTRLLDPVLCAKSGKERYSTLETKINLRNQIPIVVKKTTNLILMKMILDHKASRFFRPFQCTECDAAFKRSDHLKRHMDGTDHKSRRPYKCKICLSTFTQRKSLKIHVAGKHRKKKWHCQHCQYPFTVKASMRRPEKNSCKANFKT